MLDQDEPYRQALAFLDEQLRLAGYPPVEDGAVRVTDALFDGPLPPGCRILDTDLPRLAAQVELPDLTQRWVTFRALRETGGLLMGPLAGEEHAEPPRFPILDAAFDRIEQPR